MISITILGLFAQQVFAQQNSERIQDLDNWETKLADILPENQTDNLLEAGLKLPGEIGGPREIEAAVEAASIKTGVRKDFLMGVLVVETNLGQNMGKCTYQEVEEGARDMHARGRLSGVSWRGFQKRNALFKKIAKNLNYDYQKLKVSCNPWYQGTGGAMGLGQFMPDTWLEYEQRVIEVSGNKKPDPWKAQDAALAVALKLADVPGVIEHEQWAERNAAKLYLSGNTSARYNWYADQIMYWARNYKKLLV